MSGDLISRKALEGALERTNIRLGFDKSRMFALIEKAPAVDAVEVEEYNELREAFVDYVCSGIHNPAPYCKNKCEECIDNRGWCIAEWCIGFNPSERRSE